MAERTPDPSGWLDAAQLDLLVRRLEGLPSLPGVVVGVLELTSPAAVEAGGADACLAEGARLISRDPALAARAISLAALEGQAGPETVSGAAKRLGLEAVRSMALAAGVLGDTAPVEGGLDRPAFLRHCLAVASAAEMLAEQAHVPTDPETAFLAGLLHDVGKLVLCELAPKSHARALATAKARKCSLADTEREVLGVDHLVAGRCLARQWRLPDVFGHVIWLHHQPAAAVPSLAADEPLVRIVRLADALAREARIGLSGNCAPMDPPGELAAQLGIPAGAVERVSGGLPAAVERHARALRLEEAENQALYRRALADAKAEVCRLTERLRRRTGALAAEAAAFRRLSGFAGGPWRDCETADVLLRAAEAMSAAAEGAAAGRAVVCYSLDPEAGRLLAVRTGPAGAAQWRAAALGGPIDVSRPPASCGPAGEVHLPLASGEAPWREWAIGSEYVHMTFTCGGRWVGGAMLAGPGPDEAEQALAATMGLALGLAQRKGRAEELVEELAGASRKVAAERDAAAEARAVALVEDLATGAAHELNNPLAVISGRAQMMREKAGSPRERQAWQTIVDQSQRISDLISELMIYVHPPAAAPEAVTPAELLAEAAKSFASSDHPQAGSCRVDIQSGDDLPAVWADPRQVRGVIEELIANAATAGAGLVVLAAEADETGGAVVLTVRDDGCGMDEQTARRAYTPFFSAQKAGRRPGLGLAKARRIVESNDGRIGIDSVPGEGTAVSVRLPAAAASFSARGHEDDEP